MFKKKIKPLKTGVLNTLPCKTEITLKALYDTVARVTVFYPEDSGPYIRSDGSHGMFVCRDSISHLIDLLKRLEKSFQEKEDGER